MDRYDREILTQLQTDGLESFIPEPSDTPLGGMRASG